MCRGVEKQRALVLPQGFRGRGSTVLLGHRLGIIALRIVLTLLKLSLE